MKCHSERSSEDAADPFLAPQLEDRRVNLTMAAKKLREAAADLERLAKQDPANDVWKAALGYVQVRNGEVRAALHLQTSEELSKRALAALKGVTEKAQASAMVLDQAATAFLIAEPASLRNPRLAVSCAEREVAMSHATIPSRLLTLAQAYHASGQIEKGRAAAKQGLALLPALPPGGLKPNIRKLLEREAQARFCP